VYFTTIDGVRTVWVDAERPFTGAVLFRVGMYDERLRERGITHLVEHLAFTPLKDSELTFNGSVEGNKTMIWAQGEPTRVADFLSEVCRHLADLPAERIGIERGVLEQESAQRSPFIPDMPLHAYFGPQGAGMSNHYEYGLHWLGSEQLRGWSERYFTKQNAVLVFTGEPPPDLDLALPVGEVRPLVAPDRSRTPAPVEPTLLDRQRLGVAWGALAASPAGILESVTAISLPVLSKRLSDRLRHDLGRVYSATDTVWRLDGNLVYLSLYLECAEEHSREVSMEFMDVLGNYADTGPRRDEIDRLVRIYEARLADRPDDLLRSLAFNEAERMLCAWGEQLEWASALDAMRAMDLDEVRLRFWEAHRQSYFIANPKPSTLPTRVDRQSDRALPGVAFRRSTSRAFSKATPVKKITIGAEGLTFTVSDRSAALEGKRSGRSSLPVEDIELICFFPDLIVVESITDTWWFDPSHFSRGDTIERTCREQLPADKLVPRRN